MACPVTNSAAKKIDVDENEAPISNVSAHCEVEPFQSTTAFDDIGLASSTIGFARIDEHHIITDCNDVFSKLLRFTTSPINRSLVDQVASTFHDSLIEFKHKVKQADAFFIVVNADRDAPHIRLKFDRLTNGSRLVVVDSLGDERKGNDHYSQAYIDPLTSLGNRRLLNEVIENWTANGSSSSIAVIVADLDRFKQVNDTLGHGAGDILLQLVSDRIKRSSRNADTLVRLGGDEFIIVLTEGIFPNGAEVVAKRLVEILSRPYLLEGQQVNVGASVGVSVLGHGTVKVDDLIRHADLALYSAKASGRGTYRFFNPVLEKRALKRRRLEVSLRRALSLNEFSLVYQPQVDLADGNVTSFEALLRWNNPELGSIPPIDFIPLAEELGQIVDIGEWVLVNACAEAMKWPEHLGVAVNVSPVQFEDARFIESVETALNRSGLDPSRLEIEITEGVLLDRSDLAFEHLNALEKMGVDIAMDDFGTGYSSLSYLSNFPFSKIKIDQSFVRSEPSDKSRALVDAIISLGATLGMKTLAEGVETTDQYDHLSTGGCTQAQGYLISRPIAPNNISTFLAEHVVSEGE